MIGPVCHIFNRMAVFDSLWQDGEKMVADIHRRVEEQIGPLSILLQMVKKRKLMWFGHMVRAKVTLATTILQGKVGGQRARGQTVAR